LIDVLDARLDPFGSHLEVLTGCRLLLHGVGHQSGIQSRWAINILVRPSMFLFRAVRDVLHERR